jgi:hypothetical protein
LGPGEGHPELATITPPRTPRLTSAGLLYAQFAGCTLGSLQLGATVLLVPISHPPPPRVWRLLAPHVAADGRPLHHAQQAGFTGALRIM